MTPRVSYEIFIICPGLRLPAHFFSDQRLFSCTCFRCGRRFGEDCPVQSFTYETDEDIKHVTWLRLNYSEMTG